MVGTLGPDRDNLKDTWSVQSEEGLEPRKSSRRTDSLSPGEDGLTEARGASGKQFDSLKSSVWSLQHHS